MPTALLPWPMPLWAVSLAELHGVSSAELALIGSGVRPMSLGRRAIRCPPTGPPMSWSIGVDWIRQRRRLATLQSTVAGGTGKCDVVDSTEDWLDRQRQTWNAALDNLRAEGWTAELGCAVSPVEVEGTLPDGREFSLRARHETVSLSVSGGPSRLPVQTTWMTHPHAGTLDSLEGIAAIRHLLEQQPRT